MLEKATAETQALQIANQMMENEADQEILKTELKTMMKRNVDVEIQTLNFKSDYLIISVDTTATVEHPTRGILFHDGNNRTMEQLASDQAKNAMLHNMVIELLRKQYAQMDMALKERVS